MTEILKSEERRMVFGLASVTLKAGELLEDLQNDVIRPEEIEKAAYNFVLESRQAGEMHKTIGVGRLVESFMITSEKAEIFGIDREHIGKWWVGFKIDDPDVWERVKTGELSMFSIGGRARRG
jgi:hypothetical protein